MKITYKLEVKDTDIVSEEELVSKLLKNRNIENLEEFTEPKNPLTINLGDFGYKNELEKTLHILEKIKKENGNIVVYTDYDADGITGGSILWETLHLLGFDAVPYVPHRKHEGYGFSIKGIDNIKEKYHPSLIISVDHGITAREKVEYAKSIRIPIIITDHHLKPEQLPDAAEAIFHIPQLSGSGVSYFFSKAIFDHFAKPIFDIRSSIIEDLRSKFKTDYLALASIGTVADLVPLIGPSRSVVKYGLDAFSRIKREGILCILKQSGIEGKVITPYEVGFVIAPRINAVGRLEHAIDALRLLCTTNRETAEKLAQGIGKTNQNRQEMVKKAVEEAKRLVDISQKDGTLAKIVILVSKEWHEGIIGLIASKVVELCYRPVIIMTEVDGFLKGSARSIPKFHMTNFLRDLKEHLVDVGGHAQAAGFTIEKSKVDDFIKHAVEKADKMLRPEDLEQIIEADINVPVGKITKKLVKLIEQLQPFGIGNAQPVFYSKVRVVNAQIFGKTNDHLKMFVKGTHANSFPIELIAFSKAEDFHKLTPDQTIEIVYRAELNRWNGEERLRGKLIYWRPVS